MGCFLNLCLSDCVSLAQYIEPRLASGGGIAAILHSSASLYEVQEVEFYTVQ